MIIEDGKGTGRKAQVDAEGKLTTTATTISSLHDASHNGKAYSYAIDDIALTAAAGESGILYIQNTGDVYMHINIAFLSSTQVTQWKMYRNPTTGTLISGGTAATAYNMDFSSGQTVDATAKYGADGLTVTNGNPISIGRMQAGLGSFDLQAAIILGRGDTVAFTAKPAADATVNLTLYLFINPEEIGK